MKSLLKLGTLVLFVVLFQNCIEDEARSVTAPAHAQFSFSLPGNNDPNESWVMVTIKDVNGNSVVTDQKIKYREHEGKFLTDELQLPVGNYELTDFAIHERESKIVDGSGNSTSNFLSEAFAFSVTSEKQLPVDLKALATYAGTFQISVYAPGSRGPIPVSATARFIKDGTTLRTYELVAGSNTLRFDLNPSQTYELVVEKKGYAKQGVSFNYTQINKPLVFNIIPAFTMLAIPAGYLGNRFEFNLDADPGASIKIYWGDGTSQSYTFVAPSYTTKFTKHYANSAMRYVWVTGDIDEINYFYSFYGSGAMKEVDFHSLTGINEIRFGLSNGPDVIDLSNNTNLTDVRIQGIPQLQQLIMPSYHFIEYIDISGPNAMNTAAVDAVIGSIYNMSVAYGIVDGTISVAGHWGGLEGEPDFIGPPSALGLTRLEFLRDVQSWYVVPESW